MWKKVKKERNSFGRAKRETPAVRRGRTGARGAQLIIPEHMISGERASVYSDGNGKLAFVMGDTGEFKVFATTTNGAARSIAIPKPWAERIPFGTHDVSLAKDGDMLVLDLNTIAAA